ncbi:hypothetical protein [Thermococcus thioreducens]|uniref:hypothetical protein n=1 Tax=Thermococcus thioreducens TaxID=277988 RepID=UPI001B80904E|nr:hypothetical protein [Thermococcus thioreducens]
MVAKYEGLRPIRKELGRKTVEFLGDIIIIPWSVTGLASMIVLADKGKLDFIAPELGAILVLVWFLTLLFIVFKIRNTADAVLKRIEDIIKLNAFGNALLLMMTFLEVCKNITIIHGIVLTIPVILYLSISIKFAKIIKENPKKKL